jgi:ribosome-associated heat shock protein Hsp15
MPPRIFVEQPRFRRGFENKTWQFFPVLECSTFSVRLDKWLWAVRVFKTRSLAADACRQGRVTIDGQPAKPSREVKINNVIIVLKDEVARRFKVLQPLNVRVGAQKVREYAEDQTPASAVEKQHSNPIPSGERPKGSGRLTKRERRQIERLFP